MKPTLVPRAPAPFLYRQWFYCIGDYLSYFPHRRFILSISQMHAKCTGRTGVSPSHFPTEWEFLITCTIVVVFLAHPK